MAPVGIEVQLPLPEPHGLGHGDDDPVAQGRAHHGQTDAGVAGRGLDNGAAGPQGPGVLRGPDDRQGDTVLDASGGLEGLDLGQDGGRGAVGDAVNAYQGGGADELGDVGGDRGVCYGGVLTVPLVALAR